MEQFKVSVLGGFSLNWQLVRVVVFRAHDNLAIVLRRKEVLVLRFVHYARLRRGRFIAPHSDTFVNGSDVNSVLDDFWQLLLDAFNLEDLTFVVSGTRWHRFSHHDVHLARPWRRYLGDLSRVAILPVFCCRYFIF